MWALDDEKIKELIRLRFPKAGVDPVQRKLAARMIRLIHMYYRVGATTEVVSAELKMSYGATQSMIYRINRAMKSALRPSHRLKKGECIRTPDGSAGEDSHIIP